MEEEKEKKKIDKKKLGAILILAFMLITGVLAFAESTKGVKVNNGGETFTMGNSANDYQFSGAVSGVRVTLLANGAPVGSSVDFFEKDTNPNIEQIVTVGGCTQTNKIACMDASDPKTGKLNDRVEVDFVDVGGDEFDDESSNYEPKFIPKLPRTVSAKDLPVSPGELEDFFRDRGVLMTVFDELGKLEEWNQIDSGDREARETYSLMLEPIAVFEVNYKGVHRVLMSASDAMLWNNHILQNTDWPYDKGPLEKYAPTFLANLQSNVHLDKGVNIKYDSSDVAETTLSTTKEGSKDSNFTYNTSTKNWTSDMKKNTLFGGWGVAIITFEGVSANLVCYVDVNKNNVYDEGDMYITESGELADYSATPDVLTSHGCLRLKGKSTNKNATEEYFTLTPWRLRTGRANSGKTDPDTGKTIYYDIFGETYKSTVKALNEFITNDDYFENPGNIEHDFRNIYATTYKSGSKVSSITGVSQLGPVDSWQAIQATIGLEDGQCGDDLYFFAGFEPVPYVKVEYWGKPEKGDPVKLKEPDVFQIPDDILTKDDYYRPLSDLMGSDFFNDKVNLTANGRGWKMIPETEAYYVKGTKQEPIPAPSSHEKKGLDDVKFYTNWNRSPKNTILYKVWYEPGYSVKIEYVDEDGNPIKNPFEDLTYPGDGLPHTLTEMITSQGGNVDQIVPELLTVGAGSYTITNKCYWQFDGLDPCEKNKTREKVLTQSFSRKANLTVTLVYRKANLFSIHYNRFNKNNDYHIGGRIDTNDVENPFNTTFFTLKNTYDVVGGAESPLTEAALNDKVREVIVDSHGTKWYLVQEVTRIAGGTYKNQTEIYNPKTQSANARNDAISKVKECVGVPKDEGLVVFLLYSKEGSDDEETEVTIHYIDPSGNPIIDPKEFPATEDPIIVGNVVNDPDSDLPTTLPPNWILDDVYYKPGSPDSPSVKPAGGTPVAFKLSIDCCFL